MPDNHQDTDTPASRRTITTNVIKCSVKKFVDFACRSGDLAAHSTAGPTAAEGQKAHKVLQSRKSPDEESEVKVSCTIEINSRQLRLSGRVDLLNSKAATPCITEIKSCYAPPARLANSVVSLHWAQLKVYGYCVLSDLHDDPAAPATTITLRLLWYNLIANEITIDEQEYSFESLCTFVTQAGARYIDWINLIERQYACTVESASALEFPHDDFRTGQRDMAAAVYMSARDGFHLMCEAPTGIGKTVSALFPAIKSIGNKDTDRIIYLTAKNSGRRAAADCLRQMQDRGLSLSAITITSKQTTCHCSNGTCERDDDGTCPLTTGFFDRLPDARKQLISTGIISPKTIDDAAFEHGLCPFELTLQMLPWVQVVICDFNYVFDPLVRLATLTDNTNRQLLLVDEAHNLIDRARSMYSAELDRQSLKRAIADLDKNSLQTKNLKALVRAIDRWSKECTDLETVHPQAPKTVSRSLNRCIQGMMDNTELVTTEATAEVAKSLFRYAVIEELFGNHHRCVTLQNKASNKNRYRQTVVKLYCLNATDHLNKTFKRYRSGVTFSATLRPQQFYSESLGLPESAKSLSLASPFDPAQQCTLICNWVDTRYNAREHSVASIVEIIFEVYRSRRGNYQVFFPSYVFMELVYSAFKSTHPSIALIVQSRGSSEPERLEFLDHFSSDNATLAFSILGGVFGEGIDYRGDQLIGSIIVGTGLASVNLTQKLIEEDFKSRGLNGFDYASRFPGLTRVLQTAGRVIRTESDKGVVVLIDQRFDHQNYHTLYPAHWQVERCSSVDPLKRQLQAFWSN